MTTIISITNPVATHAATQHPLWNDTVAILQSCGITLAPTEHVLKLHDVPSDTWFDIDWDKAETALNAAQTAAEAAAALI